jgi:hypothetical protein
MVKQMAASVNIEATNEKEISQLSSQDIRHLLELCVEMVDLCARLTRKIDPAAAAMLKYVKDEITHESGLQ